MKKSNLKELVLIVLNYRAASYTIEGVDSMVRRFNDINIVIVDNCSNDGSFEILKNYYSRYDNISVVQSEYNGGYSYGNNYGIKKALSLYPHIQYIGIINPDVMIDSDNIFSELLSLFSVDEKIAGIAPMMIYNKRLQLNRVSTKIPYGIFTFFNYFVILKFINPLIYKKLYVADEGLFSYVETLKGSFFIMKKSIFEDIGFFDENVFLYGEENILGKKIKNNGLKLALSLNQYYYHNHKDKSTKLKWMLKHHFYRIKSSMYFNRRYRKYAFIDSFLLIISIPFSCFEQIVIYLLKKHLK